MRTKIQNWCDGLRMNFLFKYAENGLGKSNDHSSAAVMEALVKTCRIA